MGLFDDVNRAIYSGVQRKIELTKPITIDRLYQLLKEHEELFDRPFKKHSFPIQRITFSRHPQLEMQLILTVKDKVLKVTPNLQEGSIETEGFSIRTADLKNGFGLETELNRDDYISKFIETLSSLLKDAGYCE